MVPLIEGLCDKLDCTVGEMNDAIQVFEKLIDVIVQELNSKVSLIL